MPTLRILVGDSAPEPAHPSAGEAFEISVPRGPKITERDLEEVRWYLEDYLEFPFEPAPQIATRIEKRMREMGENLFRWIIGSTSRNIESWEALRPRLAETRIELHAPPGALEAVPWELLWEPGSSQPVAIASSAFVRAPTKKPSPVDLRAPTGIRVLLVISRPDGSEDVPFRSVGGALVQNREMVGLHGLAFDVLRPPTFSQLENALHSARAAGRPYHIVHFDGHGIYGDPARSGTRRGYVVFEHPGRSNKVLVDGNSLGRALMRGGVPVMVLNACRSAHSEPSPDSSRSDTSTQAAGFGSLAREIAEAGVPGVVAMRYNVYVATAAKFVAELYLRLGIGDSLGTAVNRGRAELARSPLRDTGLATQGLSDWCVPTVIEASPVGLLGIEKSALPDSLVKIPLTRRSIPPEVVKTTAQAVPFVGRHETFLALDRLFDTEHVVLLQGGPGDGKTATALEFGHWYFRSGGTEEEPLYIDFWRDIVPHELIEELERKLAGLLSRAPGATSPLWIWDDVDRVDGNWSGAAAWSSSDRARLDNIVKRASEGKVKTLLLSRRGKLAWQSERVPTIEMRPLTYAERAELAQSVLSNAMRPSLVSRDWSALLHATGGNPLAVRSFVRRVADVMTDNASDLPLLVDQILSGELSHTVEDPLVRSLGRDFTRELSESERSLLAILHFFRHVVASQALQVIANPGESFHLPELARIAEQESVAASVLETAAKLGLLTGFGSTFYRIHPGLPALLRDDFNRFFAGDRAHAAMRAYVNSIAQLSNHAANGIIDGDETPLAILQLNIENLAWAWRLAMSNNWLDLAVDLMQGLEEIYRSANRFSDWKAMVDEIEAKLSTGTGPAHQWRNEWRFVQEYKSRLAFDRPHEFDRNELEDISNRLESLSKTTFTEPDAAALRFQIVAIGERGLSLMQHRDPLCLDYFRKAIEIGKAIRDDDAINTARLQLATAYANVPDILDFDKAEGLLSAVVAASNENSRQGRRLEALLTLAETRVEKLRTLARLGEPDSALNDIFREAHSTLEEARAIVTLVSEPRALGRYNLTVATLYSLTGDFSDAIQAYQEAVLHFTEDPLQVIKCRMLIAYCLEKMGKQQDAEEYRRAASELATRHGFSIESA